ncbi:MAG TPA: alanine dehydrogenase [Gallionellaceae bacterium]|nr:alanine dehydrogenase [Gallionellaceae bacterium]
MRIGVPKEIKDHEFRVGLTPLGVRAVREAGHEVCVETHAADAIGFYDAHYREAGATIVASPHEVYACDLVIKVKEPQASEAPLLREGLALFCYLHLAASRELTEQLIRSKALCIAYETVLDAQGNLPLLTPMSAVAGRLAIQMGAWALTMANGGSGVLLSGVPGVAPGRVIILGGGVVGSNAARIAVGIGADVTVLDRDPARLRHLEEVFGARLKTRYSEADAIESCVREADLVVGAVLLPGKHAPKLISRALLQAMRPGSVLVDVAIDQGGCAATSRPTTLSQPLYIEEGVVHYCVTNMPAAAARTSTQALTHATLPYLLALANQGVKQAMQIDPGLRSGLNICAGQVTHAHLAEDLGMTYLSADKALAVL